MPLNLRQSRPRDDWRCRLLDGVLFVIAATALVWSLPIRTPWAGLDPGWAEALVQATDHGRIFGRDVVFTFGPYHQLYTRQISDNLNLFLLGRWLYGLGWGAVMLSVRRQVGQRPLVGGHHHHPRSLSGQGQRDATPLRIGRAVDDGHLSGEVAFHR